MINAIQQSRPLHGFIPGSFPPSFSLAGCQVICLHKELFGDYRFMVTCDRFGITPLPYSDQFQVCRQSLDQAPGDTIPGFFLFTDAKRSQPFHVTQFRRKEGKCQVTQGLNGFPEFVADCKANGNDLVIVSNGLDFYIIVILSKLGIFNIELYCGETEFTEKGIMVRYIDQMGNEIEHGFKERYLNLLKQRDKTVVYIGDG